MTELPAKLMQLIAQHWGFSTLRPSQQLAISSVLEDRDSLVVMPTGGGKSLCFQAPALYRGGITVVVSPLIALMKDQVDGLQRIGINAVRFDSSQSYEEKAKAVADVRAGRAPLVFASPERLSLQGFVGFLNETKQVRAVAIDEAHCISQWGHDFRPDYRQMTRLHEFFPGISVHAYTATATPQVRDDIVKQLSLRDPERIVGNFDRPNLTFRVLPRLNPTQQVIDVIERHGNQAGIVYCLRRKDVDSTTAALKSAGINAIGYHAGMSLDERKTAQEYFAQDDAPIIVATVAFGMGIDRPDVRFVVHTAMPKTIEHYQQESGRAGRDGLASECVLFYSGGDAVSQMRLVEMSAAENNASAEYVESARTHINDMDRYCRGAVCRHKALVRYFGQEYPEDNCNACDLCLGDTREVGDAQRIAQMILSCVARTNQRFGVSYVADVLKGKRNQKVLERGHEKLSTFGLLSDAHDSTLKDWVYQLVSQDAVHLDSGEYPILKLNAASWEVMKGERSVRLIELAGANHRSTRRQRDGVRTTSEPASTRPGIDMELFNELRELRKKLATEEGVPSYRIFPDTVLIDLATQRPRSIDALGKISGIGEIKLRNYGADFLQLISKHVAQHGVPIAQVRITGGSREERSAHAAQLFRKGDGIPEVMATLGLARSTACGYLEDYIKETRPRSIANWVADDIYQEVLAAVQHVGEEKLKPIHEALDEQVSYDDIRLVLTHHRLSP